MFFIRDCDTICDNEYIHYGVNTASLAILDWNDYKLGSNEYSLLLEQMFGMIVSIPYSGVYMILEAA